MNRKKNIKPVNKLKEPKRERKSFKMPSFLPKMQMPKLFSGNVKKLLDGSFLTQDKSLRQAPFFFYVAFIAFVYIAINYFSDKTLLNIEKTREEIKELKFEYVTVLAELNQFTQASNVLKILADEGMKRPLEPPEKIILKRKSRE